MPHTDRVTQLTQHQRLEGLEKRLAKLEEKFYKLTSLTHAVSENVVELTNMMQSLRRLVYLTEDIYGTDETQTVPTDSDFDSSVESESEVEGGSPNSKRR